MADGRRATGLLGESAAQEHLAIQGYEILARNWRCRSGELDLVAAKRGVIVFIEVRTRRAGGRFGTAAESVDIRKQTKLRSLAQIYLKLNAAAGDAAIRFDVIAVTIDSRNAVIELKQYEGAF